MTPLDFTNHAVLYRSNRVRKQLLIYAPHHVHIWRGSITSTQQHKAETITNTISSTITFRIVTFPHVQIYCSYFVSHFYDYNTLENVLQSAFSLSSETTSTLYINLVAFICVRYCGITLDTITK